MEDTSPFDLIEIFDFKFREKIIFFNEIDFLQTWLRPGRTTQHIAASFSKRSAC